MDFDGADRPHLAFYGPESAILRYVRAYYLGDVDGDGCVDLVDRDALVAMLLDPAAATDTPRAAADCNEDGRLNGRDLQCLIDRLINGSTCRYHKASNSDLQSLPACSW